MNHEFAPGAKIFLDLGEVKDIMRLNGQDLGVVWTMPWKIEITKALTSVHNLSEIEVVNLWPNRLIGDAALPKESRLTKINIVFEEGDPYSPQACWGQ